MWHNNHCPGRICGTPIISISLKGNDLTNMSEFDSLFLINNTLAVLRLTGNPTLTKLWIKSARVEYCLDLGDAAGGLRFLGLGDNIISELWKDCWSGCNSVIELSLSENQLTSIPDFSLFPANNYLRKLFLGYNNIIAMEVSELTRLDRLE